MKIVTGYTGTPHITSNDDQARNQGLFGNGNAILNTGQQFALTINSATSVTIADGDGVMQGVHFRIEPGETETLNLSPGTPGYNRIDLICARYTKDAVTGVEAVDLVVIEGDPVTGTATEPTYNTGDILTGATVVDYPLHKVTFTGVTPSAETLFRVFRKLYSIDLSFTNVDYEETKTIELEPGMYYFSGVVIFEGGVDDTKYFLAEISCYDGSYGNYNRIRVRENASVRAPSLNLNGLIPVGIQTDTAESTASRDVDIHIATNAFSGGTYNANAYLRMMRIQ